MYLVSVGLWMSKIERLCRLGHWLWSIPGHAQFTSARLFL